MEIKNCVNSDIHYILTLYGHARDYQKIKGAVLWPQIESALVENEILENRQWKIVENNEIACVWATTFDDPLIWKEKNNDPSVYIHRIATNPDYRGKHLVGKIVAWARTYAKANNKTFIRLDTVGENKGLIAYYQKSGFAFLGLTYLKANTQLPAHYHDAEVSLFEMAVNGD